MADRTRERLAGAGDARRVPRRASQPRVEGLEGRQLLATLAPIADVSAPTGLGYQLPLDGGTSGTQSYSVTSSNSSVKVSVAKGNFLTIGVSHVSSGATDASFTGSLTFQLFEDLTPQTVQKIEQLVQQGFYTSPTTGTPALTSKNFHRVANGFPGTTEFIVQGGSQTGTGSGGLTEPGFPFIDEFNPQLAFTGRGQLAMANAGDDTNDSQIFITTGSPRSLDFQHTIFGQLVAGEETLQRMTLVAKGSDGTTPINPILFTSTTLSDTNIDGVVHIDTTGAVAGETSTVVVTAIDVTGSTTTRTFQVNVAANNDASGQPIVERPFLANNIQNQVVGLNQTAVFQINGIATTPGDVLTYGVGGGPATGSTGAFAAVTNGTATVDSNGVVRVVPTQGFTGVINLLVGVRDQTNRLQSGTALDSIGNYDTQKLTLTVNNGQFVNLEPIANNVTVTAGTGNATTVQLSGDTANPNSPAQTLVYELVTQPANGTISNFNETTGTFTYIPTGEFLGTDSLTYRVRDLGAPTPNLTSEIATVRINVGGSPTGAVRLIDRVLVITPLPATTVVQKKTNTIRVNQTNGVIQVRVNGILDVNQPNASDLDQIIFYGSKSSDIVRIGQEVLLPTTLDGGQGGTNNISAGGAPSTMFGWFSPRTVLKGSPANDRITGRQGFVKFVRSGGRDELFAGVPDPGQRNRSTILPGKQFNAKPNPPSGTFYRFIGKRLVAIKEV